MRCAWATISELNQNYHDEEWGVPCFDDQKLFEILTLEVMQAGLSWSTILKKREGFREAFKQFEIHKVSQFTKDDVETLLQNPNIIRHRQKIEATIQNAKIILQLQNQYGSNHDFFSQVGNGYLLGTHSYHQSLGKNGRSSIFYSTN